MLEQPQYVHWHSGHLKVSIWTFIAKWDGNKNGLSKASWMLFFFFFNRLDSNQQQ